MNNGGVTNYQIRGEGYPVVLIHGMAASLNDWSYLLPELAREGYRGHALDLLGHGESHKPDGRESYRFDSLYRYFLEWVDSLNLRQAPILIGHSLGGYLGLKYALDQPDRVLSMVLIDPLYRFDQLSSVIRLVNENPEISERALISTPRWIIRLIMAFSIKVAGSFSKRTQAQIIEDYRRAAPQIVYLVQGLPDLTGKLDQIQIPALVVWGARDSTLKPDSFIELVKDLPNT
jgi:pimeloyl-ACP methyl ester carboxylesterase